MSVFADHIDLRTAVLEETGRTDKADVFPRLLKQAEAAFNRRLRLRDQMTTTTLTISGDSVAIPSDMQEIIGVFGPNGYEYTQQPVQAVRSDCGYYAIDGDNIIVKGIGGDVRLDYYTQIPTISAAVTDSNWLLQRYPDIYLYGVSFEVAKHIRDKEMAGDMLGLLGTAYLDAEVNDERLRYSRARIRVQGCTP